MWPIFFNITPLAINSSSSGVPIGGEVFTLLVKKVFNSRNDIVITAILFPIQVCFHVGEQIIARWGQIRKIERSKLLRLIKWRLWRCPWCNGYRRRMWTRRYEFKSWTRLIAFHIVLIPLGKVWIQIFSLQLWVNSRTD